eukprot:4593412-Alexandrium_andersonii.AAC.1
MPGDSTATRDEATAAARVAQAAMATGAPIDLATGELSGDEGASPLRVEAPPGGLRPSPASDPR